MRRIVWVRRTACGGISGIVRPGRTLTAERQMRPSARFAMAASILGLRATAITAHLENGGTTKNAQVIAAQRPPHTTKLYDRTADKFTVDEVERIAI